MEVTIREHRADDICGMVEIWNEIVRDGNAFPQEEELTFESGKEFFDSQTYCAVAVDKISGEIYGLYILHPNNVGRCAHICNASYAVASKMRDRNIGRALVQDCLKEGKLHGFGVLQFNAVVATNTSARHLYEALGFTQLGTIPNGFRMKDGTFADICPYYHTL